MSSRFFQPLQPRITGAFVAGLNFAAQVWLQMIQEKWSKDSSNSTPKINTPPRPR